MANWSKARLKELGYTREQFGALPLAERNKLMGKSKIDTDGSPDEPLSHITQPAPRKTSILQASAKEIQAALMSQKPAWQSKVGNNWDDEGAINPESGIDRYHIPKEEWPEGMALQWNTETVLGQQQTKRITAWSRGGWTPIHEDDGDGWAKKRKWLPRDDEGFIKLDGMVLCVMPKALWEKQKALHKRDADYQVSLKEQAFKGGEMNATGANHPTAVGFNKISRTVERIEVPKE